VPGYLALLDVAERLWISSNTNSIGALYSRIGRSLSGSSSIARVIAASSVLFPLPVPPAMMTMPFARPVAFQDAGLDIEIGKRRCARGQRAGDDRRAVVTPGSAQALR